MRSDRSDYFVFLLHGARSSRSLGQLRNGGRVEYVLLVERVKTQMRGQGEEKCTRVHVVNRLVIVLFFGIVALTIYTGDMYSVTFPAAWRNSTHSLHARQPEIGLGKKVGHEPFPPAPPMTGAEVAAAQSERRRYPTSSWPRRCVATCRSLFSQSGLQLTYPTASRPEKSQLCP